VLEKKEKTRKRSFNRRYYLVCFDFIMTRTSQGDKNRGLRNRIKKPKGGAPPVQANGGVSGSSMEIPPPPQETSVQEPPMEPEISEPVDVRIPRQPFASPDYAYSEGLPGEKLEKGSAAAPEQETLGQTVEKIHAAIAGYLAKLIESETGIGMIKRKIVPAFFKDKEFSDEEIGEIVAIFDDQKMKEKLIGKAFDRVDGYFSQEKALISQIWQDEKLSGSAIGTICAALNGTVEEECRMILAEKGAEKATAAEREEKKKAREEKKKEKEAAQPKKTPQEIAGSQEFKETVQKVGDALKKAYKDQIEQSKKWEGYNEEEAAKIVEIDAQSAVRRSSEKIAAVVLGVKDENERQEAEKTIKEFLMKIVFEEHKQK
jgi:hypothetical protein